MGQMTAAARGMHGRTMSCKLLFYIYTYVHILSYGLIVHSLATLNSTQYNSRYYPKCSIGMDRSNPAAVYPLASHRSTRQRRDRLPN